MSDTVLIEDGVSSLEVLCWWKPTCNLVANLVNLSRHVVAGNIGGSAIVKPYRNHPCRNVSSYRTRHVGGPGAISQLMRLDPTGAQLNCARFRFVLGPESESYSRPEPGPDELCQVLSSRAPVSATLSHPPEHDCRDSWPNKIGLRTVRNPCQVRSHCCLLLGPDHNSN